MNVIVPACQVGISPQRVVIFFENDAFYRFNILIINDLYDNEMIFCGIPRLFEAINHMTRALLRKFGYAKVNKAMLLCYLF
jgi:hypothetical protein